MLRTIFVGTSLVLALVAGSLYYAHTRQVPAVVAAQDLKIGTRISENQLQLRQVHPNAIPAGAVHSTEAAVGRYVTFPILAGQYVPARAIADRPASAIGNGIDIPHGYRVISIPISPAMAVGGALRPGDYVDVFAVSTTAAGTSVRAPTGSAAVQSAGGGVSDSGPAEVVGRHVLVLGLRSDQGAPLDEALPGNRGLNFTTAKVGSLLLAIPPQDAARYSAAAAGATFFVALGVD